MLFPFLIRRQHVHQHQKQYRLLTLTSTTTTTTTSFTSKTLSSSSSSTLTTTRLKSNLYHKNGSKNNKDVILNFNVNTYNNVGKIYQLQRQRKQSYNPLFGQVFGQYFSTTTTNTTKDNDEKSTSKTTTTTTTTTTPTKKTQSENDMNYRIVTTLLNNLWPTVSETTKEEEKTRIQIQKQRVVASIGLMIGGKLISIQVPYLFKDLVDQMPQTQPNTVLQQQQQQTTSDSITTIDPTTTMNAIDTVSTNIDPNLIGIVPISVLIGYGISRSLSSGFAEYRNTIFAYVAQDTIRTIGVKTFSHIMNQLDVQYHLNKNTGQLSRTLDRGQRSISFLLNSMVFNVIPTILEVSLVTGLMTYTFGYQHGIVVVGTVTTYTAFTFLITQWRTKFRRNMVQLENISSSRVLDSLLNYETVQYYTNSTNEIQRYEQSLIDYHKVTIESQISLSYLNFGQNIIFSTGLTCIMYLTCLQIINGTASIGDLVLVNGLLFQLSVPLFFIGSVYREVKQGLVDLEAMFILLDTKPTVVNKPNAIQYNPYTMGTSIQLNNIHFAYPTGTGRPKSTLDNENNDKSIMTDANTNTVSRPILRGTTLSIQQGQTVGIVGSSGCGKSTILRLLFRFYDPSSGTILLGGQPIENYNIESVRKAIAIIPQDTILFNDTILYNIQYGNLTNSSYDDVITAAKQAKIHDTILSFPDGYNTIVGERGLKLSGGEKQRVAIARAILKRSPIILCDEPTSSLDSESENDIMTNLKSIMVSSSPNSSAPSSNSNSTTAMDRTAIIIAHRLSTVQDCDAIIVMDQGTVVECGTHSELVNYNGRYTELLRMQEHLE